jgi:hypothetical protein
MPPTRIDFPNGSRFLFLHRTPPPPCVLSENPNRQDLDWRVYTSFRWKFKKSAGNLNFQLIFYFFSRKFVFPAGKSFFQEIFYFSG